MIPCLQENIEPRIYLLDYLARGAIIENLTAVIRKELPKRRKLRILDAGCGSKPYKKLFEGRVGKYICLDIKPGKFVDCVASVENIPFPDKSFDVIISIEVLEHVENPEYAIREFYRVLDWGGVVLATVPFIWEEHGDYQRWTSEGLKRFFNNVFEEVKVIQSGGSLAALFQILNLYIHNFIPEQIKVLRAPFYIFNNLLGRILDRVIPSRFFTIGMFAIAKKASK